MKRSQALCALITYAQTKQIIDADTLKERKKILFSLFKEDDTRCLKGEMMDYETMMNELLDQAYLLHLYPLDTIDERDAFEAKLMDILMPSPKQVKAEFHKRYLESPQLATHYLYQLSKDVNYIKVNRLKENRSWTYPSAYGPLGITINLAKPEKDPRDIAKAKDLQASPSSLFIPKCVICKENEQNYYNARMNLRLVPLSLGGENWYFQYSPYQYYPEHAIILHEQHKPMLITDKTFTYLLDFVDQFENYFIGSNSDIPLVGGSILNHDHFQAGVYEFPIETAKIIDSVTIGKTTINILQWPLSTIRIISPRRDEIIRYGIHYLNQWKVYQNRDLGIIPFSKDQRHNSITPIVRKKNSLYELDIIFRNNRTSEEYPLGIFHPHEDVWHIKKENIGLIEAMGLAILPGRLKKELAKIKELINQKTEPSVPLNSHLPWIAELKTRYPQITTKDLEFEVGKKFQRVLEDSGVFKQTPSGLEAFTRFVHEIKYLNP